MNVSHLMVEHVRLASDKSFEEVAKAFELQLGRFDHILGSTQGQRHRGERGQRPGRSNLRALCATALGALRAGALSIGGNEKSGLSRDGQERINALPTPPTSHRGRRTSPGQGRQGFAERQSPHGRHVRPTIESMTGRRASSFGSKMHGSLGCGWAAPQTALSKWGRFCCAETETWDARSTWMPATG